MSDPLTPADVRDLFSYENGALIWRDHHGARARAGAIAGTRDKNGQHAIRINGVRYMRARLVWAWHHLAFPEHSACHINHDASDDDINNLRDLDPVQRRQLQRNMQRDDLPVGVKHAHHGYNFTAHLKGVHLGSFKSADAAHAAYKSAHLAEFGAASMYRGAVQC